MIEIRQNVKGDIICKETEDAKGIGTIWIFEDLQNYIIKNRVSRNVLHHLCLMSIEQMERITDIELKESEIVRLASDMERNILHLYYSEDVRDFDVEFIDDEIEFREGNDVIQRITLERFESDLEYEPDVRENALQLINFALQSLRLNDDERSNLANRMVQLYSQIQEKRAAEQATGKKKRK